MLVRIWGWGGREGGDSPLRRPLGVSAGPELASRLPARRQRCGGRLVTCCLTAAPGQRARGGPATHRPHGHPPGWGSFHGPRLRVRRRGSGWRGQLPTYAAGGVGVGPGLCTPPRRPALGLSHLGQFGLSLEDQQVTGQGGRGGEAARPRSLQYRQAALLAAPRPCASWGLRGAQCGSWRAQPQTGCPGTPSPHGALRGAPATTFLQTNPLLSVAFFLGRFR